MRRRRSRPRREVKRPLQLLLPNYKRSKLPLQHCEPTLPISDPYPLPSSTLPTSLGPSPRSIFPGPPPPIRCTLALVVHAPRRGGWSRGSRGLHRPKCRRSRPSNGINGRRRWSCVGEGKRNLPLGDRWEVEGVEVVLLYEREQLERL